jgi:hypothetical protein
VADRSVAGLALMADWGAAAGAQLRVRPAGVPDALPWADVTVQSCQPADPSGWQLGCEFVRTPPANVLMLFG